MQEYKSGNIHIVKRDDFILNQCIMINLKKKLQNILCASTVWSLMYAQVCTHLNMAFIIGMLDRYLSNSGMDIWKAAKRVIQCPQRTND